MSNDPARTRFFAINAVRMSGAVLVLIGILIARGLVELPEPVGYSLIAAGMAGVFVLPLVLARRWRTPK